MADDHNPPLPMTSPHVQPAPTDAAEPSPQGATTAPPSAPSFSTADLVRGLLRSTLHLIIGAAVGAVAGVILNYLLVFLGVWSGDVRLVAAAGLLAGVFFNRYIIHALRLTPAKEREARTATAPAPQPAEAPAPDSLRETVETVVFVVVLVLLLKSFDAEAFVIPTGSMAETLLGYQKWVVCPTCGYKFPANASQQVDPSNPPAYWISGCTCPNCRQPIRFIGANGESDPRPAPADAVQIADPPWGSGDRVLVSKFAYDLTGALPDRMDVVVFKFPGDEAFPRSGPFKDGVPMNYIKRLVGLPGETIAIHGGDLYVLPADKGPQYDDLQGLTGAEREDRARQLWTKPYQHQNQATDQFKHGDFTILRKGPEVVLAEHRIVYDNDHPAKDLTGPAWARWAGRDANAGWNEDNAHGFRLAAPAPSDHADHWLSYNHILRDRPGTKQLITDFMGYNTVTGDPRDRSPGEDWVGDLILECEVQADQPAGELTLELSRGVDRFRARFDLSNGVCTLARDEEGQEKPLGSKPTALKGGGKHSVRFADVDERLTVWVDDALPFGDGVTYPPPPTEGPKKENDLQPASIGLKNVSGAVHGVRLWRDTYYTTARDNEAGQSDHGTTIDLSDPNSWNNWVLPTKTLYVQPGHFLCLGDNSPKSSDGRFWGLVPERLLLGKAIAIYYPFDRFGRIR